MVNLINLEALRAGIDHTNRENSSIHLLRELSFLAQKPNIVLINCDDLGYGDLGCYGSECNQTPAIDRLAAEGRRLTNFYMASPVCSPSRGAMMTGCYPRRIGFDSFEGKRVLFPGQGVGLSAAETTVASLLKGAGYRTKIVGKWHCGDQVPFFPTRHGFDSYYGLPYSNDMGRQVTRPSSPPLPLLCDEQVLQAQPDQRSLTERYVEQCTRFIREESPAPFFLYLAHMHVHLPHYVPQHFLEQSENGEYGAAVACIDWATDVILQELDRQGLADRTVVIFTSDNGSRGSEGGSNAPLRGSKGSTWEGGMRVPCIVRWPGKISPGTVSHQVATAMDFLPTFARWAEVKEIPAQIDGKDISSVLLEAGPSPHQAFFYYNGSQLEAVRQGAWKLHVYKGHQPLEALYNLNEDVGEETNLYAQHPEIVARLEALLDQCRQELGDQLTATPGASCRPIGQVSDAKPLTEYDPSHPYIIAMYDKEEVG